MAIYDITIEVTDPDVSAKTLRWLLSEAGEILELTKWAAGDVPSAAAENQNTVQTNAVGG